MGHETGLLFGHMPNAISGIPTSINVTRSAHPYPYLDLPATGPRYCEDRDPVASISKERKIAPHFRTAAAYALCGPTGLCAGATGRTTQSAAFPAAPSSLTTRRG